MPGETVSEQVTAPPFMTVKEVAEYLHLNEKKIYALIKEGGIPATKTAGKWLFPRQLVDEWLLESSHGGVLTDRLIIAGSDDPLLASAVAFLAAEVGASALVTLAPTGTRLGLALLAGRRANVAGIHWGPAEAADRRHPQLLRSFPGHREWALVRMANRQQGIMLGPASAETRDLESLLRPELRWALRQEGAGSQHFLDNTLASRGLRLDPASVVATALTERHAASLVAQNKADCAPGVRSAAGEFGLAFLPLGWECFDLVLPQSVYFRRLFQQLLQLLGSSRVADVAASLSGYDLSTLGRLLPIPAD